MLKDCEVESIAKEIVIKTDDKSIDIAYLEDKHLVEYVKEEKEKRFAVGNLFLGKVKKIMNGLNAAFVDIGSERDAFLHYHDLGANFPTFNKYIRTAIQHPSNLQHLSKIRFQPELNKDGRISEVLRPGQYILVQITKEPINNKGPRLTTEITIPGRNIVLLPFSNKVSVSQKIKDKSERERLRQLMLSIKPNNFGVIIRTAAYGKKAAVLDGELRELLDRWNEIIKNLRGSKPPRLVLREIDRPFAYLRDVLNNTFKAIYVDNQNFYYELKDYLQAAIPGTQKLLRLYTGKADIFDYFGVEKQIKSLFRRTVPLKKGSYLIIEHTEALHVIDVNSGNRTASDTNQEKNAFEVNLVAAEEIARQLRLRDIGGIIVVDFIDMKEQKHKEEVYKKMKKEMAKDRAKHTVLPLTKFGLMQITRQRIRPEIEVSNFEPCPVCHGTGQISPSILIIDEIEDSLKYIVEEIKPSGLTLKVHPIVHAYLTKGMFSKALKWKFKYKFSLKVRKDKSYHFLEYQWFDSEGKKISLN